MEPASKPAPTENKTKALLPLPAQPQQSGLFKMVHNSKTVKTRPGIPKYPQVIQTDMA